MRVVLTRAYQTPHVTMGMLQIEGLQHDPIFTLENPFRSPGYDSLIPAGVYTCKPHDGPKYKNVWEVCNVPGHTAILIHGGNTEPETLGCILIGLEAGMLGGRPAVKSSQSAVAKLRAFIGRREFELEIRDHSCLAKKCS